jgi:hypothetical protein
LDWAARRCHSRRLLAAVGLLTGTNQPFLAHLIERASSSDLSATTVRLLE